MKKPPFLLVNKVTGKQQISIVTINGELMLSDLIADYVDKHGHKNVVSALNNLAHKTEKYANSKQADKAFKKLISLETFCKIESYLNRLCDNKSESLIENVWSKWEKYWNSKQKKTPTDKIIDHLWQR